MSKLEVMFRFLNFRIKSKQSNVIHFVVTLLLPYFVFQSIFNTENVSHKMSFYLKPPRGVITLNTFENCIQQRLNFYNSDNKLALDTFDCLVEDSGLDRTGHYMLRLYASCKSSFYHIFIQNEQKLLEFRLNSYDLQDTKRFLRRLLKHCEDVLEERLSENLQELCSFLRGLTVEMLNPYFLKNIFYHKNLSDKHGNEIFFSVPFEFCYSLIVNREFNLSYGNVEINCQNWKRLLVSIYGIYLKTVLKEMKFNKYVHHTLSDDRIRQIIKSIQENTTSRSEGLNNVETFDISKFHEESTLFPLCMRNLYMSLLKTNRLAHNERFDFSLFMKGIGVTMGDSLKFWEHMYSKEHSSCSKCTHSWQKNERKYIYGIRHLYGLEGSRKNYHARSCTFLQEKSVGPIDEGGCPFTHFDDKHLKNLLTSILPQNREAVEVIIHQRKTNPNKSCKLLHQTVHENNNSTKVYGNDTEFGNPVQYYLLLKDGLKKCDTEL